MLFISLGMVLLGAYVAFSSVPRELDHVAGSAATGSLPELFIGLLIGAAGFLSLKGLFTLQPNEARLLILLGSYKGTVKHPGFLWANPFYSMGNKISLRSYNMTSETLKVNDKRGNPIEIAAVIVWRVNDTAQAVFDVVDYAKYVKVQSETAIRHLANSYAYDHGEENEATLRSSTDEISEALNKELQERLSKAGVLVEEARITHLAYAPEIAQVMLRRQQAEAVIAARQKIVQGAVSMVEMALRELSERGVVKLDDERRAAMVSNLLVILCGESEATPVVNTGTLYQ
jgi:regulator of protease activity HflC (stomatin/prohibitin superfamily)